MAEDQDPGSHSEPASALPDTQVTPAFPGSTDTVTNSNAFAVTVTITGGSVSSVKVAGSQVGTTDGTYTLPAGETIAVTYTGSPSWVWSEPGWTEGPTDQHAASSSPGD